MVLTISTMLTPSTRVNLTPTASPLVAETMPGKRRVYLLNIPTLPPLFLNKKTPARLCVDRRPRTRLRPDNGQTPFIRAVKGVTLTYALRPPLLANGVRSETPFPPPLKRERKSNWTGQFTRPSARV